MSTSTGTGVTITADLEVPIIHSTRDFRATPAQLQSGMSDGYAMLDALRAVGDV